MNLLSVYWKLLSEYDPQDWWPGDSQYEIVMGALLTQNTNWKNAEKAINNLKKENLLSPKKILSTPLNKLKKLIRPAGYYNQKSIRLKLLTKKYLEVKNKNLNTMELRKEFLSVKGVGKETADSILLYAFNKPIFVIDAYTRRMCKKLFNKEFKEYDEYRDFFESNLPKNTKLFNEFHALIVEWGKMN